MTSGSYNPQFVLKATLCSSPSLMQTLLNPHHRSSFVKYLVPHSRFRMSEMSGSGYEFLTVTVLSFQLSWMRCRDPSFFLMKNTGAPNGDFDRQILPLHRFSWRKSSSSLCSRGDRGKVQEDWGSAPGVSSMPWSQGLCGGSLSNASFEKTSLKSQ